MGENDLPSPNQKTRAKFSLSRGAERARSNATFLSSPPAVAFCVRFRKDCAQAWMLPFRAPLDGALSAGDGDEGSEGRLWMMPLFAGIT